jgi:hypothetical protein
VGRDLRAPLSFFLARMFLRVFLILCFESVCVGSGSALLSFPHLHVPLFFCIFCFGNQFSGVKFTRSLSFFSLA